MCCVSSSMAFRAPQVFRTGERLRTILAVRQRHSEGSVFDSRRSLPKLIFSRLAESLRDASSKAEVGQRALEQGVLGLDRL
jgi:hypothetical protein